jgi:MFS family permease
MSFMSKSLGAPENASGVIAQVLPYALLVFLGYLAVGLPLAAIPLEVHDHLGFGTVTVGAVVGLQAVIAILTRPFAGRMSDRNGARITTMTGGGACAVAGLLYLIPHVAGTGATASLALLMLGRAVLGLGDSLLLTGAMAWAIGAVGARHSGKVMVWVGIAIYGAIAVGGPLGIALQTAAGFHAVALAAIAPPLAACAVVGCLTPIAPIGGARVPLRAVVGLIWRYGAGLALATIGFGAISAFIALDYQAKGWAGAGYALTAFGAAYIAARLLFGHLPDRHGGLPIARISLAVEVVGQLLLWLAPEPAVALLGAALAGAGFSLVFPALGVEAVKHVPPQSRGAGMGAYVAFFDLGLGIAGPATGAVAAAFGTPAAFAAGAIATVLALLTMPRSATLKA